MNQSINQSTNQSTLQQYDHVAVYIKYLAVDKQYQFISTGWSRPTHNVSFPCHLRAEQEPMTVTAAVAVAARQSRAALLAQSLGRGSFHL